MKIYFTQFMQKDQCYIKKMQYVGKERKNHRFLKVIFRKKERSGGEAVYYSNQNDSFMFMKQYFLSKYITSADLSNLK